MWFRNVALALSLTLAAPALADETPAPSPSPSPSEPAAPVAPPFDPKEVTTLQNYGLAHPECAEWSDGCAVCVHSEPSQSRCSLPGVACQPTDLVCRKP